MKRLFLVLMCCGCSSSATNDEGLFTAGGGVAGGAWTGGQDAGGAAGAAGSASGGAAGQAPVCVPGTDTSCSCVEGAGHRTCNEQGSGYGVCRNDTINACCGSPDGWLGCGNTGCGVCDDLLVDYPNYFANHPECFVQSGCGGSYGACSSACPEPSDADK